MRRAASGALPSRREGRRDTRRRSSSISTTRHSARTSQGMREIVAYAPIEPDGSVRVKVPANVPLAVSMLDANGRRITARHQNWFQVVPGQELKCNGCHAPHDRFVARSLRQPSRPHTGRSRHRRAVPEYAFDVLARRRRDDGGDAHSRREPDCRQGLLTQLVCPPKRSIDPSVNLLYCDAWTNPAVRAPDASFTYDYAALKTTAPVTDTNCIASWSASCRIVISYEAIIHPLWGTPRQVLDPMTQAVLADHTCNQGGCHAPTNAMAMAAVPAGQLDLTRRSVGGRADAVQLVPRAPVRGRRAGARQWRAARSAGPDRHRRDG